MLIASSNGDIEVVKALLGAGANPNHALPNGQTVLMSAVVNGQGKVIDVSGEPPKQTAEVVFAGGAKKRLLVRVAPITKL